MVDGIMPLASWGSYPNVFNLGHKAIAELTSIVVNIEEKVDGSQISFGRFEGDDFDFRVRSKGAQLNIDAPEKMFARGVEEIRKRKDLLHPGWTYRGEYLAKPKHNALAYSRTPIDHIVIFDINTGDQEYLPYGTKALEAERIGFETVPLLMAGMIELDQLRSLLEFESFLGGQKIEGVVLKPREYNLFGQDKKVLMGKFVSEAFKETHAREWKTSNPTSGDILAKLGETLTTPARWQKARMHLDELGQLEGDPRDIGKLIKEVPQDILKEETEFIKDKLFAWAWPHLARMSTRGLPEWYKDELMKEQFNDTRITEGS